MISLVLHLRKASKSPESFDQVPKTPAASRDSITSEATEAKRPNLEKDAVTMDDSLALIGKNKFYKTIII